MAYDGLSERTQPIDQWPETGGEEPTDEDRDRLTVHGVWETLLGVVVVMCVALVFQTKAEVLTGSGLQSFLLMVSAVGFVAVGASWSLRAAVPNLAVGSIALASAVFFGHQSFGGFWFGVLVTVAAAAALGVLTGLLVVGIGVPPWAGSLAVALLLGSWLVTAGRVEVSENAKIDPGDYAVYWFLGFLVLTLAGGIGGAMRSVRRAVGAYRRSGEPAERPTFNSGMAGFAGIVGSCTLASLGGVLVALLGQPDTADLGIGWTGLAFGAVLLGGTSAYGRRGAITGTLLGVLLIVVGLQFVDVVGWSVPLVAFGGVALLVGLLVTRVVETWGRPRADADDELDGPDWASHGDPDDPSSSAGAPPPGVATSGAGWSNEPPSNQLPQRPAGRAPMALPVGSGGSVSADQWGADSEATTRLGGPTGPGGAGVSEPVRGDLRFRGALGHRAGRSPARQSDGVISGDVVPGHGGQGTGAGDPTYRNRIWGS